MAYHGTHDAQKIRTSGITLVKIYNLTRLYESKKNLYAIAVYIINIVLKARLNLQSYDSCLVGYLPLPNLFTLTPQVNTCITPTFSRAVCDPAALYSPRFLPPFIIVLCSQLMAVFVTMLSSSFIPI